MRSKSPLSFSGLRSKTRQATGPEVAPSHSYAASMSPTNNSRGGRLFRKKSISELSSRPTTPTGVPSPHSNSPGSRMTRARLHQRSPSSTSSIVSDAAFSVRELTSRGSARGTPLPKDAPAQASPKRRVYGREDVARYRAGNTEPTTKGQLQSLVPQTQASHSMTVSVKAALSSPSKPSSTRAPGDISTMCMPERQPASLGRNGTLRAMAASTGSTTHIATGLSEQSFQDATAGEVETMASYTVSQASSPRTSFASVSRSITANLLEYPNFSASVIDVRDEFHADPTDRSSERGSSRPPRTSTTRRLPTRNDSTSSRKSLFQWAPASGLPALVRRGSRSSPLSTGNSVGGPAESKPSSSSFSFLRSASALDYRNDSDGGVHYGEDDGGGDNNGDGDDDGHHSIRNGPSRQRVADTAQSHIRRPSYGSSLFAGMTSHTKNPSYPAVASTAASSTRSGLPLFRRPRTSSQGANSMLSVHSFRSQEQADARPPGPFRWKKNNAALLDASSGFAQGTNRLFANLGRTRSVDPFRADHTVQRQEWNLDILKYRDLASRPSTCVGNYLDGSTLSPAQDGRQSLSSVGDRGSQTGSQSSQTSRRRIPSIYSLASVKLQAGTGGGEAEAESSEHTASVSSGSSSGWKFGKGWIRSRKDTSTGLGKSPMSESSDSGLQRAPLSSPANSATQKWLSLPEVTAMTTVLGESGGSDPGLIFGVPLREAVIRTRFISPVIDDFVSASRTLSSFSSSRSSKGSTGATSASGSVSARHPRRRPSRIGLLDLGSDFSLSSDIFSSATSLSSQTSSLATSTSTHNHALLLQDGTSVGSLDSAHDRSKRRPVDRSIARKQYLPRFVTRCIESLETYGLDEEGVYRLTGRSSHTLRIRQLFDGKIDLTDCSSMQWADEDSDFEWDLDLKALPPSECDNNSVCSALKAYLRELPSPILSKIQLARLEAAIKAQRSQGNLPGFLDDHSTLSSPLSDCLADVEPAKWYLLRELALHLGDLTRSEVVTRTKMTLNNLSLVLAPTLCIPVTSLNFIVLHRNALFAQGPQEDVQLDKVREGDLLGGSGSGSNRALEKSADCLGAFSFPSIAGSTDETPSSSIPDSTYRVSPKKDNTGPGVVPRLRYTTHQKLSSWSTGDLLSAPLGTNHRDSQASVATITPDDRKVPGERADDSASTLGVQSPHVSIEKVAIQNVASSISALAVTSQNVSSYDLHIQPSNTGPVPGELASSRIGSETALNCSDGARETDPTNPALKNRSSRREELRDSVADGSDLQASMKPFSNPYKSKWNAGREDTKAAIAIFEDAHRHLAPSSSGLAPTPLLKGIRSGTDPYVAGESGTAKRGSAAILASNFSSSGSEGGSGSNRFHSASASSNSSSAHLPDTSGGLPLTAATKVIADGSSQFSPSPSTVSEFLSSPATLQIGRSRSGSTLDRPRPPVSHGNGVRFLAGGRSSSMLSPSARPPPNSGAKVNHLALARAAKSGDADTGDSTTPRGAAVQAALEPKANALARGGEETAEGTDEDQSVRCRR